MTIPSRGKCHATSRSKGYKPCGNDESYPGTGSCVMHGGLYPATVHKALRRNVLSNVVEKVNNVVEGTIVYPDNPFDALNQTLIETRRFKELIERKLDSMGDEGEDWRYTDKSGAEQLRSEVALYERALDRMAKVAVAISKLNLEERFAKLSEQQAMSVIYIINEVFKRCGLDDGMREYARSIVPIVIQEMMTQTGKKRYI